MVKRVQSAKKATKVQPTITKKRSNPNVPKDAAAPLASSTYKAQTKEQIDEKLSKGKLFSRVAGFDKMYHMTSKRGLVWLMRGSNSVFYFYDSSGTILFFDNGKDMFDYVMQTPSLKVCKKTWPKVTYEAMRKQGGQLWDEWQGMSAERVCKSEKQREGAIDTGKTPIAPKYAAKSRAGQASARDEAEKERRRNARCIRLVDNRSTRQTGQAAKALADDVRGQMMQAMQQHGGGDSDHFWYGGIAASHRIFLDRKAGTQVPIYANEIYASLFRPNALVIDADTGKRLSTTRVQELLKDGTLRIFLCKKHDKSPLVVDDSEDLLQQGLLESIFGASSGIRSPAAGTCAGSFKKDGLADENGYVLFGFVILGARTDKRLVVANAKTTGFASREARDKALASYKQRGRRASTIAAGADIPDLVRLERKSGLGSGWCCCRDGGKLIRIYGLLSKPEAWVEHTLDFGESEAGQQAARALHEKLVRTKEKPTYGQSRNVGPYSRLKEKEKFTTLPPRASRSRDAQAEAAFDANIRHGATVEQQELEEELEEEERDAQEEEEEDDDMDVSP